MTRTHTAIVAKAQGLTIQRVRSVLRQEAQAWAMLRGLQWGYGRGPLCPRCGRACWADDTRDGRKRWECQACPKNPRNRNTTKFTDAVNTPFHATRESLALALLLFAYGLPALPIIKMAKVPAAQIPTQTTLSPHGWKDKSLFRRLRWEATRLRSQQFDLCRMVRDMKGRVGQEDEEKACKIRQHYDQKIDALKTEISELSKKKQEELRALRRYRPIGLVA